MIGPFKVISRAKSFPYRPNTAALPNSTSISSNRLYLAIRSLRQAEPVLICPPPIATAKSARKASSVSPDRWDTTYPHPAFWHIWIASMVSVTEPIWLSLMRTVSVDFFWMPREMNFVLVT